jgi:hypothetical protein
VLLPLCLLLTLTFEAAGLYAATPFIDSLSPPSASPGAGPLLLTIHGADFAPDATVQFDGQTVNPSSSAAGRIAITIPASVLSTPHTASITVVNPGSPALIPSAAALFPISYPSSGIITARTEFNLGRAQSVVSADFNLDGNPDIAVSASCASSFGCPFNHLNVVAVLQGDGAGAFHAPLITAACVSIGALATGDFNRDGKPDLAGVCDSGVQIFLGDGTGNFQVSFFAVPFGAFLGGARIVPVDLNNDGNQDLLISGILPLLFTGDGTGNFTAADARLSSQIASVPGDFNNDGILDLASVDPYSGFVTLWLGDGKGSFTSIKTPVGIIVLSMAGGDFNGDGNLDLVLGYYDQADRLAKVLMGDGTGHFTAGPTVHLDFIRNMIAGDLNADGRLDIAAVTDTTGLHYLLGDNTGGFIDNPAALQFENSPPTVALADFNKDGKLDFAVTGLFGSQNSVSILIQTPSDPASIRYSVTDICAPQTCAAYVLGDSGVVAGRNFAVYPGDGITDLLQRTGQTFEPTSINASGVISGSAGFAPGQSPSSGYAAVWLPQLNRLLNLDPVLGWTHGIATFVNDAGDIVGYSEGGPPVTGLIPGISLTSVFARTDNGVIIGADASGPLLYTASSGPVRINASSLAHAFNSTGQVLLTYPAIGSVFTPLSGTITQPPAPGFTVTGFNTMGQFTGNTAGVPGIYTAATDVVPLNSLLIPGSGWTITGVSAINNNGDILATGVKDGRTTSLLLSPSAISGARGAQTQSLTQRPRQRPESGRGRIPGCQSLTFNLRDACGTPFRDR